MLEPSSQDIAACAPAQKIAVHVDDIPQTMAEEITQTYSMAEEELEVPANVEVELYDPDELTLGYYLTGSELDLAKSHLFGGGNPGFIPFGQVAIPKHEIKRVIFYPENN